MASESTQKDTPDNEPRSVWHRVRALVAGLGLLALTSGCGVLDFASSPNPTPTREGEAAPSIVVTVGGPAIVTATTGVAPTIPDSTPLPRPDLPTRDPAAAAAPAAPTPRPAVSAAARAAQPPPMAVPVAPRPSPSPGT
jgi:hypothetical protein